MKTAVPILCAALILPALSGAEIIPGQAVSWTDFSHITGIAVGHSFAFFAATDGILRYNRLEDKWYDPITISDGLRGGRIQRLAVSFDDEQISVETDGGYYSYRKGLDEWFFDTEFPAEDYRSSRPQLPLPLLMMPIGYQMYPEGYVEDSYFRRYQITAWLDDYFSSIFVGTWGLGPVLVDNRNMEAKLMPYGLLQKSTDAIYLEGDSIWLGGNAGDRLPEYADARLGVTLFNRYRQEFSYFEPRYISGFDSEIIYDITGDDKNLYFAGRLGLTIRPRAEDRFFTLNRNDGLPDNEVTAVVARSDSVWIGTASGLALYTPSVDTVLIVGKKILGSLFITDLEIAGNKLVIGTTRGAYYIDLNTRKIGRLKDPAGNLGGFIHHIAVRGDDLLISSEYGVTLIDLKTQQSSQVPYLTSGNAYAAAVNDRYIAAAVDEGLMLIERATGKRRVFTEDDGLLSIKINAIVPDGDYLWLGSEEGLTRFKWVNPDRAD